MAFSDLCHISNAFKAVENEADQSDRIMEENSMVRDLITKILDETGTEGNDNIPPPEKPATTIPSNISQYPIKDAATSFVPSSPSYSYNNNLYNFNQNDNGLFNIQNGFNSNGFVNYSDNEVHSLLGVDPITETEAVTPEQLNLLRLAAQEIGGAQFTSPNKYDEKFYNFFEPNQRNSLPETNMFSNNYNRPNSLNLDLNYNTNYEIPFNTQRFPNKYDNGFLKDQTQDSTTDLLTYLNQINISGERPREDLMQNDYKMPVEINSTYQNEEYKMQEERNKMFFNNRNYPAPNKNFNNEFFMNDVMPMPDRNMNQNYEFSNQTIPGMAYKPNGFHPQNDFIQRRDVNQMLPRESFQGNGNVERVNFDLGRENVQQTLLRQQEIARQMNVLMRNRPPPNQLNVDVSFIHEPPFNLGLSALLGPSPPVPPPVMQSPMLDMPLLAPFYAMRNIRNAAPSSSVLHARLDACYEQWRQLERERKRTEARLALAYPGRAVSSSNSIPVPRLPPCPTRVDRLTVDMLREHTKVLTLMGKMETLRASVCVAQNKRPNKPEENKITVLKRGQDNVSDKEESFDPSSWKDDVKHLSEIAPHSEVESAMLAWRSAVAAVQAARRRELNVAHLRYRSDRDRDPILQLAEAVKQLCVMARRARCAMWCDLTLTVALAPHAAHSEHSPTITAQSASPKQTSQESSVTSTPNKPVSSEQNEEKPETQSTEESKDDQKQKLTDKDKNQRRTQNYRKGNGNVERVNFDLGRENVQQTLLRQQEIARQMNVLMRNRPPPNQLNVDVSFIHEPPFNLGLSALLGPSPPVPPPVMQSPMLDMPLLAPFYAMRNIRNAAPSSSVLHARLDACYEQWRQLERERKRTEARLALAYPGRAVSSSNSIPVPRLPPCPTRVDRLTVDMLREHTKVLTLMGKMETLRASVCVAQNKRPNKPEENKITVLKRGQDNVSDKEESFDPSSWKDDVKHLSEIAPHSEVESAMLAWRSAVAAVQAARRRELNVAHLRYRSDRDRDPILQLAEAVKQLCVMARRARCAMWCDLTLTVALAPHAAHSEHSPTITTQSASPKQTSQESSATSTPNKPVSSEQNEEKPETQSTEESKDDQKQKITDKDKNQRRTQNYRKGNGNVERVNFDLGRENVQQTLLRQQEIARQMNVLMRNRPPPNQLNVDVSFIHEPPFNLGLSALLGPSPPVPPPVMQSPMLDMPLLAPFYAMRNIRNAAPSSSVLHARLDACYEQWRQLERERKRTEARLALAYPGRAVSSSNSIPVPRLPPCPTRVDRLTVDMLREHTKVLTLMGKMETLRASVCVAQNKRPNKPEENKITVLKRGQDNVSDKEESFDPSSWKDDVKHLSEIAPHSEVESAMLAWRSAVAAVQAARRRELNVAHLRYRSDRDRDPILQLAEAVKQLCVMARRARCAMWCDLTLTVALAPHAAHSEHSPTITTQSASPKQTSQESSATSTPNKPVSSEQNEEKPETQSTEESKDDQKQKLTDKDKNQRRTQNYRKGNGNVERVNFDLGRENVQQTLLRQQEIARQMNVLMRNRPPPNQLNVDVSFIHEPPFNLGLSALLGPSPPVPPPVMQSPMLDMPLLAPFYAMRNIRNAAPSSSVLHARLDACYEQWRQLERERKRTEARLALAYPGRAVSSSNSIPVPRLPPCPTRVDRLTVDMLREHTKVLTLMGKMETLRASVCVAQNKRPNKPEENKITVLKRGQDNVSDKEESFDPSSWKDDVKHLSEIAPHSEVESAMLAWRSAVAAVQAARRRELNVAHLRYRSDRDRDPILQLAEAVKQLCVMARRARCAMWCDLTLTVALAPHAAHSEHSPTITTQSASPKQTSQESSATSTPNKPVSSEQNEEKPETQSTEESKDDQKQKLTDKDKNQRRTQNYRKVNQRNDFYQKNQRYDNRFVHNRHPYHYLATGSIN